MNRLVRTAVVVAAILVFPLRGYATDLSYSNETGASVLFSSSGGILTVTLSNNWAGDAAKSKEILTGVFFNVEPGLGDLFLQNLGTATICPTCSITNGGSVGPGGNVGGE